jgi:hypothetical protein
MEEWMYRSMFSLPRFWLKVIGQLHVPAALSLAKEHKYPLERRLVGPGASLGGIEK